MTRLFVAIPAYSRAVLCETSAALLNEQGVAIMSGIEFQVGYVPGTPYIHIVRDQLVAQFLESGADRMVFLDSDVAWEPGDLIRIGMHPHDFIGGCYRYKRERESYPVHWIEGRDMLRTDDAGMIEVAALPGGFLSLSRDVFARFREAFPERTYVHEGREFFAYFHCPPGRGEDGTFCEEWRAIGGEVWLDPFLRLTHVDGGKAYVGCIGEWLRAQAQSTQEEAA